MPKVAADTVNISLFILIAFTAASCFAPTPVQPPKEEPPAEEPVDIDTTGTVAADGVLETVTWNLEWYGHRFGPENETRQTKNFLTIIDTLNADLYAFQEVSDQKSLSRLTSLMKGYRGFIAKTMDGSQRTAFIFNTNVIDSVSSGLIKQNQNGYDWGGGRYPFYFKFNYSSKDTVVTIYAVVIHAKCCADSESYNRRKDAAQSLYEYLTRNKPEANIILLGDYNDDVDVSIYQEMASPYRPFIVHDRLFRVITKSLSMKGQATTVSYPDAVDHITVSNELFDEYIKKSEKALTEAAALIKNYGTTTSDHYPVWAKFKFAD